MSEDASIIELLKQADEALNEYADMATTVGALLARKAEADNPGWKVTADLGDYDCGPDVIRLDVTGHHCWDQVYQYGIKIRDMFQKNGRSAEYYTAVAFRPQGNGPSTSCKEHGGPDED